MPIGEAHKSGQSFSGLCEYILSQGIYSPDFVSKKPEIVFRNHVFATDYVSLGKEFRDQAKENPRVKKPVMHLTVNFSSSDQISNKDQKQFVKNIMSEMGVSNDNHQYAVIKHNDKHPHFHIVVNRVGFDGVTLSDSNSKLRIGTATDKIEKEMGLDNYLEKTRAYIYDSAEGFKKNVNREVKKDKPIVKLVKDRKIGVQNKKNFVQIKVLNILNSPKITSLEELKKQLSDVDIEFKYTVNVKEQIGVSFRYQGLAMKGSQIQLTGNIIKRQLEENRSALKKLNVKSELKQFVKETSSKFHSSLKEIIDTYKAGNVANIKNIFAKNNILLHDQSKFTYKDFEFNFKSIIDFDLICKERLEIAKGIYAKEAKRYDFISNQKYKNGIFGILTSEQRSFNDILKLEKERTSKPLLNVRLDSDDFLTSISNNFERSYYKIDSMKVERNGAYFIDYNFLEMDRENQIPKAEVQKEYLSSNLILPQIGNSVEEDEEPKRKRKFKR